jgi:hypothetical protein
MRLSGFNDGIQEAGAGLELCQESVLTGWFKVNLSENRIPLNPYTQWPIQVPKIELLCHLSRHILGGYSLAMRFSHFTIVGFAQQMFLSVFVRCF